MSAVRAILPLLCVACIARAIVLRLLTTYGVTEEEDVPWANILLWEKGEFEGDDYEEDELLEIESFLEDDAAVIEFLEGLLKKYRSSTAVVPSEIAEASAARMKAMSERSGDAS